MSAAHAQAPLIPSFDSVKMEDRKRSLAQDVDDPVPSRKRLVKDENGQQMRMDAEKEKEVENYQKDAILRQMKEYKRQRKDFEEKVQDLQKKCQFHDDHLRTIDAWFSQLLDEIRVMAAQTLPSPPSSSTFGAEMYNSALLFENNETFSDHLKERSEGIRGAISDLFSGMSSASPEVDSLKSQLNNLLAREKEHAVELRRTLDDKESISERLEQASYRYMMAEKKLDRAKSTQVLKLERAAMFGGNGEASPSTSKKPTTPKPEKSEANGDMENGVTSLEAESVRREALAAAEKQKAQLDEIESENSRLTNELSAARTKLASLTDDDYAETSLFKTLKSQYEDVIKRVNDLEATNIQLREDAQKMQAERTAYRTAVDEEHRANNMEIETQIARAENDVARIRSARDDMSIELNVRKTADENRSTSADNAKELAAARDSRIKALESELERLRLQLGESAPPDGSNFDDLDLDTLKSKLRTLESQYSLLSNELPSMEAAWKKAQAQAAKKVDEITNWEEQIARLTAEKTKAEQRYYQTLKVRDMQSNELRSLKSQNARSSEIVSQLKETEGKSRELVSNLERQLAEAKEGALKLEGQYRSQEQKQREGNLTIEGMKKQVEEMKAFVGTKDRDALSAAKAKREAEVELEKCRVRVEDTKKAYDSLKRLKTSSSSEGSSADDWRKVAICPVCNANIRNTVIKLCGHVFCSGCVKDLIANRSRKCPSCGRAFGNGDHMTITLT